MLLPLLLAFVGHAAWDNVLHWMLVNDPDASILHMHWLRMVIVYLFTWLIQYKAKATAERRSKMWWFQFSLFGWTLPALSYTVCVVLTGYRIAVSLQPFIPLFVALGAGASLEGYRLAGLNFAMLGTMSVWVWSPWYHKETELWKVWFAMVAGTIQVTALSKWVTMLPRKNTMAYMTRGVGLSVLTLFFVMLVSGPEHLAADFVVKPDKWLAVLLFAGIGTACKNWMISSFTPTMTIDAVAIFECLHPIATLCSDIVLHKDVFEYEDIATVALLATGWILYPKRNI